MKTTKLSPVKALFIFAFGVFGMFSAGCTEDLLKAKDETVEAVDNLKNEAMEAKEDVENAVEAVNEAAGSLKAIGE